MDKFEIKPSSSVTAEISPIILKSGEKIETEFCPMKMFWTIMCS